MKPHPKVNAATLAAAATTVVVAVLDRLHVETTPTEQGALTVIFVFLAGYVRRGR